MGDYAARRGRSRSASAICFEHEIDGETKRVRLNQRVDPSDDDRFETREPDGRAYDDTLPEASLPGSGSVRDGSGENELQCGERITTCYCRDCGSPSKSGATCRRSRCPRCWQSWDFYRCVNARDRTGIIPKLESLRAERHDRDGSWWKFHHLVVSCPSIQFNSQDALERGYELVKALMNDVDVDTGYIFYHPYRIRDEYRGEVNGHDSGNGDMTWKDILEKVESDDWTEEAVRSEFLTFQPHFHVVALSRFVQGGAVTKQITDESGIVIERITKCDSNKSIEDLDDLAKVTAYCLSHTALLETDSGYRAGYRPFGEVANHSASESAIMAADQAMRSESFDVLGVDFTTDGCDEPEPTVGHDHADGDCGREHDHSEPEPASASEPEPTTATAAVTVGSQQLAGAGDVDLPDQGDDWDTGPAGGRHAVADGGEINHGPNPDEIAAAVSGDGPLPGETTCGGRLRPIWLAEDDLANADWCDDKPDENLKRLRDGLEEWKEHGQPTGDEIAPPG